RSEQWMQRSSPYDASDQSPVLSSLFSALRRVFPSIPLAPPPARHSGDCALGASAHGVTRSPRYHVLGRAAAPPSSPAAAESRESALSRSSYHSSRSLWLPVRQRRWLRFASRARWVRFASCPQWLRFAIRPRWVRFARCPRWVRFAARV